MKRFVRARQIGMYLARTKTESSFSDIGRVFGRDHSTVIQSVRSIEERLTTDAELRTDVETLSVRLTSDAPMTPQLEHCPSCGHCPTCGQSLQTVEQKMQALATLRMSLVALEDGIKALERS